MRTNKLYFAQHGLAVDKTENPERPLSASGIAQTRVMAVQLQKSDIVITDIFHSGKLRALQTAEIFAEALHGAKLSAVDYLSPNDDIQRTIDRLQTDAALYIGHLPHLNSLVTQLVSNDQNLNLINFRNSAVLCIETGSPTCQIRWYITPELVDN